MEPYDRIMAALNHTTPDRTPIDYIATPEFHAALKKHLRIDDDEILLRTLGIDIRRVAARYSGPAGTTGAAGVTASGRDFLGIVWKPVKNDFVVYNEIAYHPLGEATTVKEIEEYSWPSVDWFDFSHLKDEIGRINSDHRYAILYFAGGAFETPWYMRGMERFLMDLRTFKDMGLVTFYHSCGSIVPVIGDFIGMELDILDPIQPKAAGMNPEELKRRFGDRLTFHGGIDEQELLPRGTPLDVRREVGRLIGILGKDGGYIICPAHAIQPDTPVENITALYEAAREMQ